DAVLTAQMSPGQARFIPQHVSEGPADRETQSRGRAIELEGDVDDVVRSNRRDDRGVSHGANWRVFVPHLLHSATFLKLASHTLDESFAQRVHFVSLQPSRSVVVGSERLSQAGRLCRVDLVHESVGVDLSHAYSVDVPGLLERHIAIKH